MTPRLAAATVFSALVAVAVLAAGTTSSGRQSSPRPGITIRSRFTAGTAPERSPIVTTVLTSYLQDDRTREESRSERTGQTPGAYSAVITRCDPRQVISIDPGEREYTVTPLPAPSPRPAQHAKPVRYEHTPNLLVETTTVDTGERKLMFGQRARHVITTERRIPLDPTVADAGETVTDGWYIDLDTRLSCERYPGAAYGYIVAVRYGSPPPIVSFKNIGEPETGHAVASTTTITFHERLPDGTTSESVSTWSLEVTEITKGPLDPALFEAPAGFLDVTPGSWGYYWKGAKQWLVGEIQRLVG